MYRHISYILIHVYKYLCVFMYIFIHIYTYSCIKNFLPGGHPACSFNIFEALYIKHNE